VLQVKVGNKKWATHLYVDARGEFCSKFNNEEKKVLNTELASEGTVGWLRNFDRKSWALCVPYDVDGEDKPIYTVFLFVRRVKSKLVVDIIEPHTISLGDAPAKAAGLAKFAAKHADKFGWIELILIDGSTSKKFDLTDESVSDKLNGVKLPDQLKKLVAES